jgi:hypothetical protein
MCSLPSVICIKTAPITTSSVAMYSQNGMPAIGAFITGGEDKYFLCHQRRIADPSELSFVF